MQKQNKSLCFAALALLVSGMPTASNASWNFGVLARLGINWFGIKKPKVKGISKLNFSPAAGNPVIISDLAEDVETKAENFGRMLQGSIGFTALYSVSDLFKIGGIVDLGISFSKELAKDFEQLYLSEGFVGKIGLALGITDWVLLTAGLRMAYVTAGLDLSTEQKNRIGPGGDGIDTAPASTVSHVTFGNLSASTWAWGLFADLNLLIPVTDNFKAVLTIGIHGDVNELEFKDVIEVTTSTTTATVPLGKQTSKVSGRLALHGGIGVMYTF